MSDEYGLGFLPSPPDPRDYPLELAPVIAPLPRRYVCPGMGPVLNQGSRPTCVAHAAAGLKTWEEKADRHGVIDFDREWLYARCKETDGYPPGTPGTDGRSAMKVLRNLGCRAVNHPAAPAHFRIAAYYAVPLTLAAIKAALMQYGPICVGGDWYDPWFRPVKGILPPAAGPVVGGHEQLVFGYDDDVAGGSLLVRGSWGLYVGSVNGNTYCPYNRYLPSLGEAWKALDLVGLPG